MVLDNLILKLIERSGLKKSKLEGQVRGKQRKLAELEVKM